MHHRFAPYNRLVKHESEGRKASLLNDICLRIRYDQPHAFPYVLRGEAY